MKHLTGHQAVSRALSSVISDLHVVYVDDAMLL